MERSEIVLAVILAVCIIAALLCAMSEVTEDGDQTFAAKMLLAALVFVIETILLVRKK